MTEPRPDSELIRGSLTSPELFTGVFERYWDVLFRYFERRLGEELAADLAAEVFRIAFEDRSRFRTDSDRGCLPWLYGIAANLVLKERRRFARQLKAIERFESLSGSAADGNHAESVIDGVDAAQTWIRLRAALLELDASTRELLLLLAWEELSYQELAEAFEIPVGTVRSRVHRGRTALRNLLGPENQDDPETHVVEKEVKDGR